MLLDRTGRKCCSLYLLGKCIRSHISVMLYIVCNMNHGCMVQDIGCYSDMMLGLYVVFVSTEIWPLSGEDSRDIYDRLCVGRYPDRPTHLISVRSSNID